jgi:hypothetical protein
VPRDAAPSHSTDTKSKKDDTTQNKPPAWSPSQRTDHNSEHPESETHTGETANNLVILRPESPKKDWWDYAGIAGGFFIALLTLGLAIIAWIQAKAAKASAEATINAERAWLLPVMVQPMLLDSPPGNEPQMCAIACKITNYGKTPARVFESVVKLHILNSGDALPEQPDYRTEGKAANSIPGEFVLRAGKGFDQILFTAPTHIAEIKTKQLALYVYGFVRYRHVFSTEPARVAFCFLYHLPIEFDPIPEGFYSGGPEAYRETT